MEDEDFTSSLELDLVENVCLDWHQGKINGHLSLQGLSGHKIDTLWINPSPKILSNKEQLWFNESTVLLTCPITNPNHQFWDVLVNLFPLYQQTPPFTHWIAPIAKCDYWLCELIPILFNVLNLNIKHIDNYITNKSMVCFHQLYIPKFGLFRGERIPIPYEEVILPKLNNALTNRFVNNNIQPINNILIYGKEDTGISSRCWNNARDTAIRINTTGNVHYISNMAGLSFTEQCEAFWNARHILYIHGGHTANLICTRKGTFIDEFACPRNIGWFQKTPLFHKVMSLNYIYSRVPGCWGLDAAFHTPDAWFDKLLYRSVYIINNTQVN